MARRLLNSLNPNLQILLALALFVPLFVFLGIYINQRAGHADTSVIVNVPDYGGCGSKVAQNDATQQITDLINDPSKVPNGTQGAPTIVNFHSGSCYDIENIVFFNGGASVADNNGKCAAMPYPTINVTVSPANCSLRRHDIVLNGNGAQFEFFTDGHSYQPTKGTDVFIKGPYGCWPTCRTNWYILGGQNITLEGINMTGPPGYGNAFVSDYTSQGGVTLDGVDGATLQNSNISHVGGDFVTLMGYFPDSNDADGAAFPATDVHITGNTFNYAGRMGISFIDTNWIWATGNTFSNDSYDLYDVEADSGAWSNNNVYIDGNNDGSRAHYWLSMNGYANNIYIENEQASGNLTANIENDPSRNVNNINILNNTATGTYGYNPYPLMIFWAPSTESVVNIEGNYDRIDNSPASGNQIVIGAKSGDTYTIEKNTFPVTDVKAPLALYNEGNSTTRVVSECGNILNGNALPPYSDGPCSTPPPTPTPTPTPTPPPTPTPTPHNPTPTPTTIGTSSGSSGGVSGSGSSSAGSYKLTLPAGLNPNQISSVTYSLGNQTPVTTNQAPFALTLPKTKAGTCQPLTTTVHLKTGQTKTYHTTACPTKKTPWRTIIILTFVAVLLLSGGVGAYIQWGRDLPWVSKLTQWLHLTKRPPPPPPDPLAPDTTITPSTVFYPKSQPDSDSKSEDPPPYTPI